VLAGTFTPLKNPTIAEEKQLLNDYLAKHALAFSSKITTCKFHNATAIICISPSLHLSPSSVQSWYGASTPPNVGAAPSNITTCKFHNATAIICPSPPSFD